MTDHFDLLVRAAAPADAERLAGLEDAVWLRIDRARDRARMRRIRIAVVAVAVVVGVVNGGSMLLAPRPQPTELSIFTVSGALSPLATRAVRG